MRVRGRIGRAALTAASIGAGCAPPAGLRVVSAEERGLVSRPEAIVGRDGGGSAAAFGRSVWVYGDTVLRDVDARGTNWHTNSYELRDRETWREAFEAPVDEVGAPRLLVDLTDEERAWNEAHGPEDCPEAPCHAGWALWPSEPLYDEAAGRAWLLYGLYSDAWPSGIGVASWGGLDAPVERRRVGGSWLLFPGPETE